MKVTRFIKNARRAKTAWIPRETKVLVGGKPRGPNATETRYLREIINPGYNDGRHLISYEPAPIVITRTTSREYTADFLVQGADMRDVIHEVQANETDEIVVHKLAEIASDCAWCDREYGE